MTAVILIEVGRHSGWLFGDGRVIAQAVSAARAPRRYDRAQRALCVPVTHIDDIAAAIEHVAGAEVRLEQVDR